MDAPYSHALERISKVKAAVRTQLLSLPGVHAIGIAYKTRGGRRTDELSLVLHVLKKRPATDLPPGEAIPAEIDGIPTDVVESEIPEQFEDSGRYRPLRGGSRLEWDQKITTATGFELIHHQGTLGCCAKSRRKGKNVILTNAHVVAACADPATGIGRRIGQPDDLSDCTCCSKCWATVVGTVIASKGDPSNPEVDVAVIELDKCVDPSALVQELGSIAGALTTVQLNALMNQTVRVRGAKTAAIRPGEVESVDHDGQVTCRVGDTSATVLKNYTHAITVRTDGLGFFAQPGDSGSVVLDAGGNVVGLLFGGSVGTGRGLVCRIDNILNVFASELDLEILTSASVPAVPATAPGAVPAPHPFAALPEPETPEGAFNPSVAELDLLGRARDEILATARGQHFMGLVSKHLREVQTLIQTRKRVAAVWRQVAAPELARSLVGALQSPQEPIEAFVEQRPLHERIAAMAKVLSRYGSETLRRDLALASPVASRLSSASYAEALAWLRTEPVEAALL